MLPRLIFSLSLSRCTYYYTVFTGTFITNHMNEQAKRIHSYLSVMIEFAFFHCLLTIVCFWTRSQRIYSLQQELNEKTNANE